MRFKRPVTVHVNVARNYQKAIKSALALKVLTVKNPNRVNLLSAM